MPLPSAVQKIGNDAEALAVSSGMKQGGKPLAPVETSSAVIEPINEPVKTDQNDYKTRYSNYKKATDQTISELRTNLATTQATLANAQRQNQDLLTKLSASTITPPVKEVSLSGTKDDPAYKKWFSNLAEHIKDEYTEDYLFDQFTIQQSLAPKQAEPSKSSDYAALENKLNSVVQYQEKTKAELYEDEMDVAFPNDEWITLANGPEWSKFCLQTISAADSRAYGDVVKQGSETHNAAIVTWVLNQYKQHQQSTSNTTDSKVDPLMNLVTPEGAGGGGGDPITEINAKAETFTLSQVNEFFKEVATGKKYSAEDADAITKQIMAAQDAGKILQG